MTRTKLINAENFTPPSRGLEAMRIFGRACAQRQPEIPKDGQAIEGIADFTSPSPC